MGQWENNVSAVLNNYANGRNSFRNMPNVVLGGLVATELERQAEQKRQLEVQKQKDKDAALERKLKLQEMQFKMDALDEAREQAKNNQALLTTLAPYKPSYGFDSETGENVISGSTPLDSIVQATANSAGLNLLGLNGLQDTKNQIANKALENSVKAMSLYSSDPQKYKELSEKQKPMKDSVFTDEQILSLMADANDDDETRRKKSEELSKIMEPSRQKGRMTEDVLSDVLAPYEISYEARQMSPDIYKANKIYDRSIYNTDMGYLKSQEKNQNNLDVASVKGQNAINKQKLANQGQLDKTLFLRGIKEGSIKLRFDNNGKISGYERVNNFKPSLTPNEIKEYELYEKEWIKRFKELEIYHKNNLDFDKLVDLTTSQMETIMKSLKKNKLKLFGEIRKQEIKNVKAFDDAIQDKDNFEDSLDKILNNFNNTSQENPKGLQQVLRSESGFK